MDTDQRTAEQADKMVQAARAVAKALADFSAACARAAAIMQSFNKQYASADNFKKIFPVRNTLASKDD